MTKENIERAEVLRDWPESDKDEPIDYELAATRIELARNLLDAAINDPANSRSMLLRVDAMLKRLKYDLGFPKAGLGKQSTAALRASLTPNNHDKESK